MIHSKAPCNNRWRDRERVEVTRRGAGEMVRPRRLISASARPLNFTVLDRPRMARRNS